MLYSRQTREEREMKKRLTVLLGAGAAHEIGFPQTPCITKEICSSTFIKLLYTKTCWNFEQILQFCTQLYRDSKNDTDRETFLNCQKQILRCITGAVAHASDKYTQNAEENSWYDTFWKTLADEYALDIISLNYDTLFENRIFQNRICNGYDKNNFEPALLEQSDENRIIHLHGCIGFYTMPAGDAPDTEKTMSHLNAPALYWNTTPAPNEQEMLDTRYFIYTGSSFQKTSIVTDENTYAFENIEPFKTYRTLYETLLKNHRLLTIGYNNRHVRQLDKFIHPDSFHITCGESTLPAAPNTLTCGFKKSSEQTGRILEYFAHIA